MTAAAEARGGASIQRGRAGRHARKKTLLNIHKLRGTEKMDERGLLYQELRSHLLDRSFLRAAKLDRKHIMSILQSQGGSMAEELSHALREYPAPAMGHQESGGALKRFDTRDIVSIAKKYVPELRDEPAEGWVYHCYKGLLHQLYPHMEQPEDWEERSAGRFLVLQIMRSAFSWERKVLPFDPTREMDLLSDQEVTADGFTSEYIHMHKLIRSRYVHEFARIGIDITPFNTLGHIGGVHYVAMHMARQLYKAGVPVDLALMSGAAATHDVGKYGCRSWEARRVPYLHYYYSSECLRSFGLNKIEHIAANHSTWDLELENLSVESLLLIYADFRTKSDRNSDNQEVVHFYSLKDAFQVILNKLDNVDQAKENRYRKVYAKLKDFEDYMVELGASPELPEDLSEVKDPEIHTVKREMALLGGFQVIDQLKYDAIQHNIALMSRFNSQEDFASLLENARSARSWNDLRTYMSILGEYFTYMTENQKSMTLQFLYEVLSNRESDIRDQAASIMGSITARYSIEYNKELPDDALRPAIAETNVNLFRETLDRILDPGYKYTRQHQIWIMGTAGPYINSTLANCGQQRRPRFLQVVQDAFSQAVNSAGPGKKEAPVIALLSGMEIMDPEFFTEEMKLTLNQAFLQIYGKLSRSVDFLILELIGRIDGLDAGLDIQDRDEEFLRLLDVSGPSADVTARLSTMFLDNLKTSTPWVVKKANISFMLMSMDELTEDHCIQIATHFANLLKVSETVAVRRRAGEALVEIMDRIPYGARNEVAVELINALDLGDYQFTKYIPDYLGILLFYLKQEELDETLDEMEERMLVRGESTAIAILRTCGVMLQNMDRFIPEGMEEDKTIKARRMRILYLILKGFGSYRDVMSREAFNTIGELYGSGRLTLVQKNRLFRHSAKKLMLMIDEKEESELDFYNDAAALNQIYRFINQFQSDGGGFRVGGRRKSAFFPGTFDPFSLGHKAIATTIRDKGFDVYLALDEFSWSKNTQPHMLRRQIIQMSTADQENIYLFPEDIPINIANPDDIAKLKSLFKDSDLYIAVGSDVVKNASSYRIAPGENTIHSLNHIIFDREVKRPTERGNLTTAPDDQPYPIQGEVVHLSLAKYYEDISSTRIRENIDLDRDVSTLVDPMAQSFIYENSLYSREPTFKHVLQARSIRISSYQPGQYIDVESLVTGEMARKGFDPRRDEEFLENEKTHSVYIENTGKSGKVIGVAAARRVSSERLLDVVKDPAVAARIRKDAAGRIAVIGLFYYGSKRGTSNLSQILLTEIMARLLEKDYTYCLYIPVDEAGMNPATLDAFRHQGFVNISGDHDNPVLAVDMRAPIVLFRDVETVIKNPFNKSLKVQKALDSAHMRLLHTFNELFPGKLIMSFNTSAVYSKIIDLVAKENGVTTVPGTVKDRGPYISVPFGKALSGVLVPNTVTKELHTGKYFTPELQGFQVREARNYSKIENQVKTIKSFGRDVILIDDLLHKGYRMKSLLPIFQSQGVNIRKIVVGVLTGNAKDQMTLQGKSVDAAYFIPGISIWANERDCYPFIGGDSVDPSPGEERSWDASINFIMPFTSYSFVGRTDRDATFRYSMTCLENALEIMKALEADYQERFGKKLTLGRLGETIKSPVRPEIGRGMSYDMNLAPSTFIESNIVEARRMHMIKTNR